jgi:hypothetical protein
MWTTLEIDNWGEDWGIQIEGVALGPVSTMPDRVITVSREATYTIGKGKPPQTRGVSDLI